MNESEAVTLPASQRDATTRTPGSERWLFVDGASAFGGHEVMLLRWLEELTAQRTVNPFLLARSGSTLQREGARHATVLDLPPAPAEKRRGVFGALRDVVTFVRAAWTVRPRVCVVAEGCLLSQPLFLPIARLIGLRVLAYVPMLQTSVSMGFANGRLRDAIVRRAYARLPHGWITITREQAEDFRAWARARQPILILQNTVSRAIEAAGISRVDRSAPAGHKRLRVVVLGRLEAHQKGLDMLLDYAGAHPELGHGLELTLVGTGPLEATIVERLQADPVLRRWLSLAPWSSTTEVLQRHDLLLMTSRYEGVPLVMLEAMALGVPVVAPDLAGTRGFLTPDCLFPVGDMQCAFQMIAQFQHPIARESNAEHNHATFRAQASNAAFAAAVRRLTPQVRALGRRQRSEA